MSLYEFKIWDWLESKFGIPKSETPSSLPWSSHYTDEKHEYDWDDWRRDMKKKYPIRYWIFHEFSIWASVKYRICIEDPIYWFKSIFINKQHLLDLRKGVWNKTDPLRYKFGYTDPHNVIEMALYVAFVNYLEELEANYGPKSWNGEPEVSAIDMCIKIQQDADGDGDDNQWVQHYKKVKEIKIFFEEELPKLENSLNAMSLEKPCTREEASIFYKEKDAFEKEVNSKLQEKFIEIIKIRQCMWT